MDDLAVGHIQHCRIDQIPRLNHLHHFLDNLYLFMFFVKKGPKYNFAFFLRGNIMFSAKMDRNEKIPGLNANGLENKLRA